MYATSLRVKKIRRHNSVNVDYIARPGFPSVLPLARQECHVSVLEFDTIPNFARVTLSDIRLLQS